MKDIMLMGKNPNFLGSWDLYDAPNECIVATIDDIRDEEVINAGKKEGCTVCHFRENIKPMILNLTNKKTIAKLYKTKSVEQLIGKRIKIVYEKVKAFGTISDALRIRHEIPKEQPNEKERAQSTVICEKCGNAISGAYGMEAEAFSDYTKKKLGKKLCKGCASEEASKNEAHE